MFESMKSLLPPPSGTGPLKAWIVADHSWGADELRGLFETLGGVIVGQELVKLRKVDPKSYVGPGKLQEIAQQAQEAQVDVLLFDFELSPTQMKSIEKITDLLVLDRSGVILEIFGRHARTSESKLQVECARLEYLMPRLTHMWSHFERQRGSGGVALKGKGMGETQIEVDRRLVKERLAYLRKKLQEVAKAREVRRKGREDCLKVALVGYTNAGKSTLLNALTDSDVLVKDALFATLDSSVRLLNPKSKPLILAVDTVGFIDRLPHGLVASFRSTLSAVLEADLLVHVLDASSPELKRHFQVTAEVLEELGAKDIPMILVCNKIDLVENLSMTKIWAASLLRENPNLVGAPLFVTTKSPLCIQDVRRAIEGFFEARMETLEIVVPYEDGRTLARVYEISKVDQTRETPQGIFMRIKVSAAHAQQNDLYQYMI